MPNVNGFVYFSPNRTIDSITTLVPIPSIPITLYNPATNIGACILSNNLGQFQFESVPAGSYTLIESFGATPSGSTPFNFNNATTLTNITPKDPNISAINSTIPQGSNNIDSLTPNTIYLKISNVDLLNQHFVDGPVIYQPVTILNQISTGNNLITIADNGTFGFNTAGTPVNTSPSTNPYPELATDFKYQQYSKTSPSDGDIALVNIQTLTTFGVWWNLTDHTKGNETSNFLVVNGANPGTSVLTQTIPVNPFTYYAFSMWVANQLRAPGTTPPKFMIVVTGISQGTSTVIYSQSSQDILVDRIVPKWIQMGAIFNSENYSTVNVNLLSIDNAATGNDYAIDDVSLNQVLINANIAQGTKSVLNSNNPTSNSATTGDTLIYTISIANTSTISDLINTIIIDTIPLGTSLVSNSVTGGSIVSTTISNPLIISLSTIPHGTSTSISFKAIVNNNITVPNISNTAAINYNIEIDPNLTPAPGSVNTNTVNTPVQTAILNSTKTVSPTTIATNSTVVYTIKLNNIGTISTNNILFTDFIPAGLSFVPNSFYINNQNVPTVTLINNTLSATIPNIFPNSSSNISFSAIVTSNTTIINTATISYNYLYGTIVSNTNTTSSNAILFVSSIPNSDVTISKGSSCNYIKAGCLNTYTVTITNNLPTTITNVIFYDTLPSGMCYKSYSFTINGCNNNIRCFNTSVPIGDIPGNSQSVIKLKAFVKKSVCNPMLNNTACITYNTTTLSVGSICSNTCSTTLVCGCC